MWAQILKVKHFFYIALTLTRAENILISTKRQCTMENLTSWPSLVLMLQSYRNYFVQEEMDLLRFWYANILHSFCTNTENTADMESLQEVTPWIYDMAREGVPTNFLQCHLGTRGHYGQVSLLHSISTYFLKMRMVAYPWEHIYVDLK